MNKDWILKHRNRICENTACNKKYSEHQNGGACGDFVTSGKRICIYDDHDVVHCFANCIERECPSCGSITEMYGQVNGDAYVKLQVKHPQSGFYDNKLTVHICNECGLVSYYKIDQLLIDFVRQETQENIFPESLD